MRPTCQDGSDTLHIGGVSDVVRKERVCPAILEGERRHLPMSRSGWAQRPPLPARVRSALDNSFERTFIVDGIVARKPRPAQADYLGAAGPGPRARPLRPRHDRPAAPDAIPPSSSAPAWVGPASLPNISVLRSLALWRVSSGFAWVILSSASGCGTEEGAALPALETRSPSPVAVVTRPELSTCANFSSPPGSVSDCSSNSHSI
jgi:hypothetical protein